MTWQGKRRKQLPDVLTGCFALLGLDIVVMFAAGSLAHHPGQIFWTIADVSLAVAWILLGLLFATLLCMVASDIRHHA